MKNFIGCLVILSIFISGLGCTNINYSQPNIVVLVVDGCRPDYFDNVNIPNIRSLMREGTTYSDAWIGGLRSISIPSHTMIGTGAFPKRSGVICLFQKNVDTLQLELNDFSRMVSGDFYADLDKRGITSLSKEYKKLYPGSLAISLASTRAWAATPMGYGADYVLFMDSSDTTKVVGVRGHTPENFDMTNYGNGDDEWVTNLAIRMVNQYNPDVLMVNLSQIDWFGHDFPDKIPEAMENADKQIGRIMDLYRSSGKYDNTIWVILSDHGMIDTRHTISQDLIANITQEKGVSITPSFESYIGNFGNIDSVNAALKAIPNGKMAEMVASDLVSSNIEGIKGIYYKESSGEYLYIGDNLSVDLDKCYQYLISTFSGEFSHDLIFVVKDGYAMDRGKYPFLPRFINYHEMISWSSQHTVLIFSGPNIKKNIIVDSPARMIDVSPTLCYLAGAEKYNMDGIVLADCIRNVSIKNIDIQNNTNRQLKSLTEALKFESKKDMEDEKDENN